MKITYVITPFETSKYLIRCVNSILRQTNKNNEIIIAENSFDKEGELAEYFSTVSNLKLISDAPQNDFGKIQEAVSLAEDDSLINFISVDTVAVPIASQTVFEKNADIIAVSYAVKNDNGYSVVLIDENVVFDTDNSDLQNLFIKKKLLLQLSPDVLTERIPFQLWIDEMMATGVTEAVSGELCFYASSEILKRSVDDAECYLNNKVKLVKIAEKSLALNSKQGIFQFDKYLSKLYRLLLCDEYGIAVKSDIYAVIKGFGNQAKANDAARRIYELYVGNKIEVVESMDVEAYLFYAERIISLADKALVKIQLEQIVKDTMLPIQKSVSVVDTVKAQQDQQTKAIAALESEIKSLKNDIAVLTSNMPVVVQSAVADGSADPLQQIPEMFARGQLGMKVIIKSFIAWLKYKFSRKK